ncbi:hypothetical protein FDK21_20250 [Cohaesibacter sp. CAU 1516]|uniref:VOC family protein n=1 Tax=Cohaesibacter sp. CAU 1516 TaxID=2576038 RepID=UPI0010FD5D17|nr:VOC family protein [Cohaesibacter sp. CAU 1516]TLP42095.1 hypothetical protein FDK21_20250 [Cohaesibacter sp. CAU 1516]
MFEGLGILYLDHFAVVTGDLSRTLQDYLSLPGCRLWRGPGENDAQDVRFAFVELRGQGTIEILAPLSKRSPILNYLSKGGGAYHLCFAVHNLDEAVNAAVERYNARLVVPPRTDNAYHGRRVAFLFHLDHGLFELVEAFPPGSVIGNKKKIDQSATLPSNSALPKRPPAKADDALRASLLMVFNKTMNTTYTIDQDVTMETCNSWDSLKHLMLIMAVEQEFSLRIDASMIEKLKSLSSISNYLTEVLGE